MFMIYIIKMLCVGLISLIVCYLFWIFSEKNRQISFKEYLSAKFFMVFSAMLVGMLCSILT